MSGRQLSRLAKSVRSRPRRTRRRAQTSTSTIRPSSHVHVRSPTTSIARIPPSVQLLPDELENWGITQIQLTQSAVSGVTYTFKLNGPFNLFGPQNNSAGAFSTNVPAGSNYLLSSNTAAGSSAPYSKSTVRKVMVDIEVLGISTNTVPISVAMFPSLNPSVSALAIAVWREQKACSYSELSYNATSPLKMSNMVELSKVFGVSEKEILESPDYSQAPGVDPANLAYFHIYVAAMDGSSTPSSFINLTFKSLFRFRGTNTFNSTAPS